MDNVTDALHIAFGMLIFVLALSIAVSSFRLARVTAATIMENLDRENEYEYQTGEDSGGNLVTERIVGVETIIPTLYRAFIENYTVRFFDSSGKPIYLFKISVYDENQKKDIFIDTNEIDLVKGGIGNHDQAKEFIGQLIDGNLKEFLRTQKEYGTYSKFLPLDDNSKNFYGLIGNKKFKETLGVYYQEDLKITSTEDINKTKKRVITYTQVN